MLYCYIALLLIYGFIRFADLFIQSLNLLTMVKVINLFLSFRILFGWKEIYLWLTMLPLLLHIIDR